MITGIFPEDQRFLEQRMLGEMKMEEKIAENLLFSQIKIISEGELLFRKEGDSLFELLEELEEANEIAAERMRRQQTESGAEARR